MIIRVAAKWTKRVFDLLGLEIHRRRRTSAVPPVRPRASLGGALRQLQTLEFKPQTVIDVGVASETPELYEEFPEVNSLLI